MERLDSEGMPLAGLVVNRATPALEGLSAEQAVAAAERLESAGGRRPASPPGCCGCTPTGCGGWPARHGCASGFQAAHPHVPTVVVPALSTDVHDLDGLRAVGELLAG